MKIQIQLVSYFFLIFYDFLGVFKVQHIGKGKETEIFHSDPYKELNFRRQVLLPWPAGASSISAQFRRRESSDGKGKGMGSERAPRHTSL
jgi:hypothetical protein